MARNDFEDILDSVKTIMTGNLNTKTTALDAEKVASDTAAGLGTITIPTITAKAYAFQTLDEKVMNENPFIVYGIEDIESETNGPTSAEKIFISAVVVMQDNGKKNLNRILFRYSRALKEIFEENWQNADIGNRIEISRLTPVPFEALDGSAQFKAIGVIMETSLA